MRDLNRGGELAALGIKVSELGAQHRVIASSSLGLPRHQPGRTCQHRVSRPHGAGQRRPAAPALRAVDGRVAKGP